ncbi:hypothetical protein ACOME3_006715 [Neoechinorhynchus agilis]
MKHLSLPLLITDDIFKVRDKLKEGENLDIVSNMISELTSTYGVSQSNSLHGVLFEGCDIESASALISHKILNQYRLKNDHHFVIHSPIYDTFVRLLAKKLCNVDNGLCIVDDCQGSIFKSQGEKKCGTIHVYRGDSIYDTIRLTGERFADFPFLTVWSNDINLVMEMVQKSRAFMITINSFCRGRALCSWIINGVVFHLEPFVELLNLLNTKNAFIHQQPQPDDLAFRIHKAWIDKPLDQMHETLDELLSLLDKPDKFEFVPSNRSTFDMKQDKTLAILKQRYSAKHAHFALTAPLKPCYLKAICTFLFDGTLVTISTDDKNCEEALKKYRLPISQLAISNLSAGLYVDGFYYKDEMLNTSDGLEIIMNLGKQEKIVVLTSKYSHGG